MPSQIFETARAFYILQSKTDFGRSLGKRTFHVDATHGSCPLGYLAPEVPCFTGEKDGTH